MPNCTHQVDEGLEYQNHDWGLAAIGVNNLNPKIYYPFAKPHLLGFEAYRRLQTRSGVIC